MKKLISLFLIVLLSTTFIFAQDVPQENEPEQNEKAPVEIQPETSDFEYKLNQKGDWFVKVSINGGFPIQPETMEFGLDLNLGFYYFLASNFAVGGDISFDYAPTLGEQIFYCIPFSGKLVYQFCLGKFEIPLFLGVGGAIERHNSNFYFGLIVKPELGFFYRYNADWSFGATGGVSILPQWYKNEEYNYCGYIIDAGFSVRYHF